MANLFEDVAFVRQIGGDNSLGVLWGLSSTGIADQVKRRLLPKPVSISPRLMGWPANEIVAIRRARVAGKSEDEIKALVEELEAARTPAS